MLKLLPILLVLMACGSKGKESGGANPIAPEKNSGNGTAATPTPAPTTSPSPAPELPKEKDFTVLDPQGKEHKMSSLVTATYLVVTLTESSWLCFGCRGLAEGIDASTSIQGYLSGSKCAYASLEAKDDYEDWLAAFPPATSFVGARSFSTDKAFADIGKLYGAAYDDTPFTFVIDKKGNLILQGLAADPLSLANLCM